MDHHPSRGEPAPRVHELDLQAQALHARYPCDDLGTAARFAAAVAQALGHDAQHLSASISPEAVEFRLATPGRAPWVTEADVHLARTISRVAAQEGLATEAPAEAGPASGVRRSAFWAAVLTGDPEGELVPLGDRWRPLRHPNDTPGSWHVDLWLAPDVAASRIEAALSAGGRVVDDSAHPSYTVLADLHGNLACIGTVLRDEPPLPG